MSSMASTSLSARKINLSAYTWHQIQPLDAGMFESFKHFLARDIKMCCERTREHGHNKKLGGLDIQKCTFLGFIVEFYKSFVSYALLI